MYDILISEAIEGAAVDALRERFRVRYLPDAWKNPQLLAETIGDCRALLVRNQTPVTAELMDAAPALQVIGRAGVGLDNVDVEYARKNGIVVCSTPDQNAISAAELALGLMLALVRFIPAANHDTKEGNWNRRAFVGAELYGKTLGIVGAGKIGYLTARRARAFGMSVLACDPFLSQDNVLLADIQAELVSLEELFERADIVSCHLPATSQTSGLLSAAYFDRMKPTAYLVNTSRGQVVCEPDLIAALKAGRLAGAALDVRAVEPPQKGELESMPNVILTPHIGAWTHEAQNRVTVAICNDITRVLLGEPALNAVHQAVPQRTTTHQTV